eukprot:273351-Pyramimonas_sp.AAC.1
MWRCSYAIRPPGTAFRGPKGSATEGVSGGDHVRPRHPVQRFVACPWGTPSMASAAVSTYAPPKFWHTLGRFVTPSGTPPPSSHLPR